MLSFGETSMIVDQHHNIKQKKPNRDIIRLKLVYRSLCFLRRLATVAYFSHSELIHICLKRRLENIIIIETRKVS